jgi:hypothetical protein
MKGIQKRLAERISKLRKWAFENWVRYIFYKNAFFLLIFFLVYLLSIINTAFFWLFLLPFLLIPVFFLLDSKRISVAEKSPAEFVKAEKVERAFQFLFYILTSLWIPFIIVVAYSERIGITGYLLLIQWLWIIVIVGGTGLLLSMMVSGIEYSYALRQFKEKFIPKPKWHLFEFYPSETIRASTRFVVVANFLSRNPSKRAISRKFSLFREGIKIYNEHLKDDFGFVLCEPKRFYNKAKLAAFSSDKIDDIKYGLESLTELMKEKKEEPLEIVKSLKEMLNEPASFHDMCAEIDVEPKLIRKWLSSNAEHIGIIIPIVLFIAQIILYALHIIPFPFG